MWLGLKIVFYLKPISRSCQFFLEGFLNGRRCAASVIPSTNPESFVNVL